MRSHDYLIISTSGRLKRKIIWNAEHPMSLDHPAHWVLEEKEDGVYIRSTGDGGTEEKPVQIFKVSSKAMERAELITLPLPEKDFIPAKPLTFTIQRLNPLPAVYSPRSISSDEDSFGQSYRHFLYWGVKDMLLGQKRVRNRFRVHHEKRRIFNYGWIREQHTLKSLVAGLTLTMPEGTVRELGIGEIEVLTEEELTQGTLRYGDYWWCTRATPVPDQLPFSVAQTDQWDDEWLFKRVSAAVAGTFVLLMVAVPFLPKPKPAPKILMATEINLKQPKWIEKAPDPIPTPTPEPVKEVKIEPPPPAKPAPPAPPEKVARKPVPPKRTPIAKRPAPPPPVARAAPRNEPRSAPTAPTRPSAAQIEAAQAERAKSEVSKSLAFLSSSMNRAKAPTEVIENSERLEEKYVSNKSLSKSTDSSVLKNMAKSSTADGPITTKGARGIAGETAYGDGRTKSASRIRGKVALNSVSGGGGDFGSVTGSSLSVSGAGSVSESELEKVLEKNLSKFQYCYEKALLTDSSLSGTVQMQWTINLDGRASQVKVVRSQLNNNSLHSCLVSEINKISFPKPTGAAVSIRYPFAFSSGSL